MLEVAGEEAGSNSPSTEHAFFFALDCVALHFPYYIEIYRKYILCRNIGKQN